MIGRYIARFAKSATIIPLMFTLVLFGCEDKKTTDSVETSTQHTIAIVTTTKAVTTTESVASVQSYDPATLDALAKRYQNHEFSVLDASEVQLDGASTFVITFSVPLNPKQNVATKLHLVDSMSGTVDGAWELSDNLMELRFRHLQPKRRLTLTIDNGIEAINGTLLRFDGGSVSYQIETKDVIATVGFASRGSLLPTKLAEGLPVVAVNVDSVDVDFFRIRQHALPEFLSSWQRRTTMNYWESSEFLASADLVYSGRFDLHGRPNTRETILLPLSSIKSLQDEGVYLAVMKQAGRYDNYMIPTTMFTLSDIGLSVHQYHQRIDVFTQALQNGQALANVNVTLLDNKGSVLAEVKTDKSGHAQFDKTDKATLILAENEGQTSIVALNQPALDLSEFAISGENGYKTQFFAFGPRDIYRPGETLIVNGLLRDADGKTLPAQPVKVDIINADQQIARSFVWQPNEGLYQYEYVIPDNGPTGNWMLRFNLGDDQPRYYQFKVEDFMPERMALDIKSADTPILTSESAQFAISGRYLYGAPASGNTLQGTLLLRPLREAVKALPGFEFGAVNEENLSRTINEFDVQLDENGQQVTLVDNPSWSSVKSPISLIVQASLLESGGRPVTRRAEQAIWPAETLPGIRALFGTKDVYDYQVDRYKKLPMVDEESIAEFEIIYADQQGHKLAATDLQVRLVYERRDYYWRWSDNGGWESGYDQKDLVIDTQTIATEQDKATKVNFPVQWGAYRVEVVDPNNGLVSSIRFWAGYSWQENGHAGGGAVRPDQVKMKIDKPAYTAGDKVSVHLDAPVAGKGYLLVESNDEPLWWQDISIPEGGADFTVTLDKSWNRHDLYLTAIVIRPGDKSQQAMPKRAMGILHIPLASEQRKLEIKLDAPVKIEPEQLLKVKIKATSVNGKPLDTVKVLVSAVDSGVLNITDFVTPDPYQAFFGRKRYSVDIYDIYGQLIEGKGRKGTLRFGGDGDDETGNTRGGMKPITFVNIIAQQAKPVQLNAQGEAEVELYIPDFNGELRLMAQAWSDEDFGSSEQKIIVAAPLIAELSTPRFMASGDESTLALDLHNLSGVPQNIKVTLTSQGLIGLTQPIAESVLLAKDEKRILLIPVTALNGFGSGEITVNIDGLLTMSGTPRALQRKVNIGVRPAYPAKTENFSAIIRPGDSWQLPDISTMGMDLSTAEATLSISSRPPLNLKQYIAELYAYPYGCLEQTTSGLFPSLYTNSQQLQDLGIKTGTDEARRDSITVGIERLFAKQIDNGGFGYWTNSDRESFWGTVYVTDFLLSAKAQGYSVAEKPLNQAIERLKRYMQNRHVIDSYGDTNGYRFSVQAYAAFVLARQQQISLSDLRQLYERREATISGLPLVQLGVALKLMGDETRAEQAIRAGFAAPRSTKWQEDYGSSVRDKALILALLNEYNLSSASTRDQILLSLSDDLRNKRYLSTQEKNAVFMVGRNYLNSKETQWRAKLTGNLNGEWSSTSPINRPVDPQALTGGNELVSATMGNIYPHLMVTGYPLMAPAPESNNLNIKREYFDVKGQPLDLSAIKTGQLIVVHLQVSAKSGTIRDALVVDLLPAGFELENQNLGDSSASLKYSTGSLAQLVNQMQRVNIAHQEYRDDRYVAAITVEQYNPASLLYLARAVTPGTYKVPAPMVESMYQPDVRAIGQSVSGLRIVKQ